MTASSHTIRLRGPWDFAVLAQYAPRPTPRPLVGHEGTCRLPGDWSAALGQDFRGVVRFTRRFGTPTGIGERDRIHLVLDAVDATAEVRLNGHELGRIAARAAPFRYDVTGLLQHRNVLVVVIQCPDDGDASAAGVRPPQRIGLAGGLLGEVRLEIQGAEARG